MKKLMLFVVIAVTGCNAERTEPVKPQIIDSVKVSDENKDSLFGMQLDSIYNYSATH